MQFAQVTQTTLFLLSLVQTCRKACQFRKLSGNERIEAYNAVQGNLAILFGIPQSDWDNFVLKVDSMVIPSCLDEGRL